MAEILDWKSAPKREQLKKILSLLDLTTLEGTDYYPRIESLCDKALSFAEQQLPLPAAVCVYPPFVKTARKRLEGSGIHIASVAGAFPSGQSPLALRVEEVKWAVGEGADEIDMVISRGAFLAGNHTLLTDEVAAIKQACGPAHLKVILETGELLTPENIRIASDLAIEAGADFIKTSTGKIQPAATPEAMRVMLGAIADHYRKTSIKIGIKPAGGISTVDQAMVYCNLVDEVLGTNWINPTLFRIGASRLADALIEAIHA